MISEVWARSVAASPGARLVLLCIADCAAVGEPSATISVQRLCELAGLSRRGVQYAVGYLVNLGELEVERTVGPPPYNRYTIHLGAGPPPSRPDDEPARSRRRALRSRQRTIWDRDGWECQVRGPQCTGHKYLTLGHKIPIEAGIEAGGTDDDDNLQTECLTCNSAKGAR